MFNTKQYANNHSLTMRLLFMQTGLRIWKNNFWLGVGTGDVQDAFNWQYEFDQVELDQENRLRAHNQFLTFGITFGFIGFLIVLWMLMCLYKNANRFMFVTLSLLLASFLNEDTLETQIGLTMFVGFICYSSLVLRPKDSDLIQ
jgi:O-antigen ligase